MSAPDNVMRLLDAVGALVTQGMSKIEQDNPAEHAQVVALAEHGGFMRTIIDTHPGETTIDFVLFGADGESKRVFQYRVGLVDPLRH